MGVQLRKRLRFVYGDALALPFPTGEFDVVFSFDTLHHLSQCADAVGEMFRVCSDTGVVAIADLNRKGLRAIEEVMARYGDEHYHNSCRVSVVGQILKQQGARTSDTPCHSSPSWWPGNLYNERPMWLQLAHRRLDEAVFAAYGWDPSLCDDDLLAALLALNL